MASIGSKNRRRKSSGRRFIQLWTNVKRSAAYHGLSLAARCALIELLDRYSGANNGSIGLGVRELAESLNSSTDTAARALRELDDSGLASPLTGGHWKGKRATEWRLCFYVCNKTGELPIKTWASREVSDERDTKVRPEGHKPFKCPTAGTHIPKSSMSEPPKCPTTRTHIDIYQGVQRLAVSAPTPEPLEMPDLPEFLRRGAA